MTKAGLRRSGSRPRSKVVRLGICIGLRQRGQPRLRRYFNQWKQTGALNGLLMNGDLPNFLADVTARFLSRCTLAMLPRNRRHWGQALINEQNQITNPRERLSWAAGGITMTAKDFLNRMFTERMAWAASIAAGMLCAFVDLQSPTRWPYILLLCSFGLILASWQPKWAWRWTFLLAGGLPA